MFPRTLIALVIGSLFCFAAFCRYALFMTFTGLSLRSPAGIFLPEGLGLFYVVSRLLAWALVGYLALCVARLAFGKTGRSFHFPLRPSSAILRKFHF